MEVSLHETLTTNCSKEQLYERYAILKSMFGDETINHINKRNSHRYTPLHCSIFSRNITGVQFLLEVGADIDLKCHGTPPIILALATALLPGGMEFGLACASGLLQGGCDVLAKDDLGSTSLHFACELNLLDLATEILSNSAIANELVSSKDKKGFSPLHRCALNDAYECAALLISHGANILAESHLQFTPLHIAAKYASKKVWSLLVELDPQVLHCTDAFGMTAAQVSHRYRKESDTEHITAIISHPECRLHFTCPCSTLDSEQAPPENIKRLEVLLDQDYGCLRSKDLEEGLHWVESCKQAEMSDVLRVHEWPYVSKIEALCASIPPPVGEVGEEDYSDMDGAIVHLDGDTALSRLSYRAALRAAGAVCEGVDLVLDGKVKNAFCAVRPPGHHAGPSGVVPGPNGSSESHGFCLLNNVSIGAAYAMNVFRKKVKRVAIVDFDVHHGNGTEETIEWLVPGVDRKDVFTQSAFGTMHTPRYKPWFGNEDANNVLFVSVHGYGPNQRGMEQYMPMGAFYPGTGSTHIPKMEDVDASRGSANSKSSDVATPTPKSISSDSDDKSSSSGDEGGGGADGVDGNDDDDDDDDDSDYGSNKSGSLEAISVTSHKAKAGISTLLHNHQLARERRLTGATGRLLEPLILDMGVALPSAEAVANGGASGEYRHQWRNYFRDEIFPRMLKFKPDIIFISAGFDAHKKDTINAGYIALLDEDFDWVTANLVRIANSVCDGRIVSSLEGGYQTGGEFYSAFARSVKAHVAVLSGPEGSSRESTYSEVEANIEKEREKEAIRQFHEKRLKMQQAEREKVQLERARVAKAVSETSDMDVDASLVVQGEEQRPPLELESSSKRRRTSKVDYVSLDKELNSTLNKT